MGPNVSLPVAKADWWRDSPRSDRARPDLRRLAFTAGGSSLAGAGGGGVTRPPEITSFSASSTVLKRGMNVGVGTNGRRREVGFGAKMLIIMPP